jgi:hypothetical protein
MHDRLRHAFAAKSVERPEEDAIEFPLRGSRLSAPFRPLSPSTYSPLMVSPELIAQARSSRSWFSGSSRIDARLIRDKRVQFRWIACYRSKNRRRTGCPGRQKVLEAASR